MKLLLVADLHYTLRQWDWVGAAADRFDLVVVAGDLLDIASIVPIEAQIVVIRQYLRRLAGTKPLLVCSGNHDIVPDAVDPRAERRAAWLQEDRADTLWVDSQDYEHDHFYFSILPWWDGPETRRATETQLREQAKTARACGKPWIWVYHPPPRHTATAWNGRQDLGDGALVEWIDHFKPFLVLGGHIHNAPFYPEGSWIDVVNDTFVFNGGRQIGATPTFTILDLAEKTATWISTVDAERAPLRAPLERMPLD